MFSFPALHFGVYFSKCSRQRASQRVGFVLVHLISLRLTCTRTRHLGLRAAYINYPVGVLSVCVYCRRLFSFSFNLSLVFVCLLFSFSLLSWPFSLLLGRTSLSFSVWLSPCLSPCVDSDLF